MALPNCAVFSFHQTPPANATARIMLTWRMSAIGRRFTADGSATATLAAGAVAGATAVASLGAFSIAASAGVAVTAAESSLASTGFLSVFLSVFSATGTPGTGTDGAACIACADSIAADGAASRAFAAVRADSAKRSSSSGFSAPNTSSASRLRLRTSLSLNPKGQAENASNTPITRRRPHRGTATMERAPSARHACRLTRGSVSVSSQFTICAVRKHAPENAESRSMRAPTSGRTLPAAARNTISLLSARAMARPSAPVIATARSATS